MRILVIRCRSGEDFLERYQPSFEFGGIFHPTREAFPLGELVVCDVRLPNLSDQVLIRGMVAWRRPARRRTGVRAGIGIEFLPGEAATRDHLLALARGDKPPDVGQRRHRRLPTEIRVDWRVAAEPQRHFSFLDDIGPGGAFIRTREMHPEGTPVVIEVVPPGATIPLAIEGRVAWTRSTPGAEGLGVTFRCRDAGGRRRIKELIRRIEQAEA